MNIALIAVIASVFAFTAVAMGSIGESTVLHVATYSSPSGKWKLEIDPSEREGCGKGNYRMVADGKEAWRGELPFTLWDAAVTDDGVTAGYGFSHGRSGFGHGGPGSVNVVILDATGKVRLNDAVKRSESRIPDGSPEPWTDGFILHAEQDRFIMRLESDRRETWRIYQLSTAKRTGTIDLRAACKAGEAERFIIDARPITGLPLVLTQWWRYDQSGNVGAVFSILDFKGRRMWSLELPKDYTIAGDEAEEDRLRDEIRRDGAICETREAGVFELRFVAAGERVRFKVAKDSKAETGWTVTESSRAKYQAPPKVKPEPAPSPPELRHIDGFVLNDPPVTGAIRDIDEFDIDGGGRFGFLRRTATGEMTFVLVDQQANVIAEVALPITAKDYVHCAWLDASRWIITTSESGVEGKTRAWWLDVETPALIEINGFECPSVDAMHGTGDGGFVALTTRRQKYSRTDFLIRFDPLGKALWKHEAGSDDRPATMLSPEDVTVTSKKEIAVVDVIRETVQLYDLAGAYLRTIDLKKAWKREPNYPSGITPDAEGGFIVYDFNGKPLFIRMKADGGVRGGFNPKHADGRAIDAKRGVRAAPDGSLWACDGESFIQLSVQGSAVRVLGHAPDGDKLGEITAVTGDSKGNTYAVDRRTGAVHVFGPDGRKLRVCKPAKDDFTEDLIDPHIAVAADGGVMLDNKTIGGRTRYLCFDPNGNRLGFKSFGLDDITEKWHLQPGTSNVLVLGYQAAFLADADGTMKVRIERQADRRWFDHLQDAAFADDSSFVIRSTAHSHTENSVTFFTDDGVASDTRRLETGGFAMLRGYNGRVITMGDSDGVRVYDRSGKAIGKTPKSAGNSDHFLTRGGRELWTVDFPTRRVERYELP